jgi:hypothetical protein
MTPASIAAPPPPHPPRPQPPAPPSPNEGLVLTTPRSGGRRFLIRDGRRCWIDSPPID